MSQKKTVNIVQLYPEDMNIYGDWGNVLTLKKRAQWQGYDVEIIDYNVGDTFPDSPDIIVGGGGQDSGQTKVQADLLLLAPTLKKLASDGVPMLAICGMYQLFGNFFKTKEGDVIKGIGIFDIETHGSSERLIGNIVTKSHEFGEIIGYENHSGQTTLSANTNPLATVLLGAGNNSSDGHEGARVHNVIGSYLHGSLLPKNPAIADFLLKTAITRKYGTFTPGAIDDNYAKKARAVAKKRSR